MFVKQSWMSVFRDAHRCELTRLFVRARWKSVPNNHKGTTAQRLAHYKHFNVCDLISRVGVLGEKSTGFATRYAEGGDFGQVPLSVRALPSSFVKRQLCLHFADKET